MKRPHQAALLLSSFSTGIMVPVLSLALLDRGISLPSLALIFGVYSLTVFILEVPSGFLADLAGRKMVFILSNIFYLVAVILMLFADSISLLIPVIIFWGAGKAFASGSLDALVIDAYIGTHGAQNMHAVTSRLALLETAGIAAGAFLGGFLPGISGALFPFLGAYDLNLILRCMIIALLIMIGAAFIRETGIRTKQSIPVKRHIRESFRVVKTNRVVLLLAPGMFLSGLFLFTVETYWQPVYTALLGETDWTLGLLSFGCFLFATLGNILIKRIFGRRQKAMFIGYTVSRLLLFAVLAIFSLQQSAIGFSAMFFLIYFFFGGANMAESTMLNCEIPGEKRASLLSISSFVFQAGGLVAPLCALISASDAGIRTVWLTLGIALFIVSVVIGYFLIKINKKRALSAAKSTSTESNVTEFTEINIDTAKL